MNTRVILCRRRDSAVLPDVGRRLGESRITSRFRFIINERPINERAACRNKIKKHFYSPSDYLINEIDFFLFLFASVRNTIPFTPLTKRITFVGWKNLVSAWYSAITTRARRRTARPSPEWCLRLCVIGISTWIRTTTTWHCYGCASP